MARRITRGRQTVANNTPPSRKVTLGGSAAKVATVPADGEYNLEVKGARIVTSKSSNSESVILTTSRTDNAAFVKLRPLLVYSPGGDSDLTYAAKAVLETLLGLGPDDTMDLEEGLDKLLGTEFTAELAEGIDARGQSVADIVAVLAVNGVDLEG